MYPLTNFFHGLSIPQFSAPSGLVTCVLSAAFGPLKFDQVFVVICCTYVEHCDNIWCIQKERSPLKAPVASSYWLCHMLSQHTTWELFFLILNCAVRNGDKPHPHAPDHSLLDLLLLRHCGMNTMIGCVAATLRLPHSVCVPFLLAARFCVCRVFTPLGHCTQQLPHTTKKVKKCTQPQKSKMYFQDTNFFTLEILPTINKHACEVN